MILLVMLGTKYGTIIYVTVFLSCVFHCITVRFMITCIDMKIEEFEIKIVFESGQIIEKYVRNNRGSGRKNLRCFPKCTTSGHVKRGYCGNSISIIVFGKNISDKLNRCCFFG